MHRSFPPLLVCCCVVLVPVAGAAGGPSWWSSIEIVRDGASSIPGSSGPVTVQVDCPAGKRAVHGAASVGLNAVIFQNGPVLDPPTSWAVRAAPLSALVEWDLSVAAWCADIPDLESVVTLSGSPITSSSHTAMAQCPAGKHLVGGGAFAFPLGDDLASLVQSYPADGDSWRMATKSIGGASNPWFASAVALCSATGPPKISYAGFFGDTPRVTMTTRCAPGEQILGTGYELITSGPPLALTSDRDYVTGGLESWLVSLASTDGSSILVADFYPLCWSLTVFENGFETGDTSAWSAVQP